MKTTTFFASLVLALGCTLLVQPTTATAGLAWVEQLGTSEDDESLGVSADGLGNVYISGYTSGILGETNAGGADAFVAKYSEVLCPDGDCDVDGADFLAVATGRIAQSLECR